jgi:hypothetical protein
VTDIDCPNCGCTIRLHPCPISYCPWVVAGPCTQCGTDLHITCPAHDRKAVS